MDLKTGLINFWFENKHLGIATIGHLTFAWLSNRNADPVEDRTVSDWVACSIVSVTLGIVAGYIALGWYGYHNKPAEIDVVLAFSSVAALLGYGGLNAIIDFAVQLITWKFKE